MGILRRLANLWRRDRLDADIAEELRSHLEMAAEDLERDGVPPDDARRVARRRFGNVLAIHERTAGADTAPALEGVARELRLAVRGLRRSPAFSVAATLTLVIGIGAAATSFAVVRGVLLEPLPYAHSDRLVAIWQDVRSPRARRMMQSPAAYYTYRRLARTIEDVGAYRVGSANTTVPGSSIDPERVAASWTTASTFSTLGVAPLLGRIFTDEEDRQNGPNLVVISDAIWRSHFGGARDVLGKTLIVNDVPREVIGVMPRGFRFPNPTVLLWLPNHLDRYTRYSGEFAFGLVARLRPGVTPDGARRELAALEARLAELFPDLEPGLSTAAWIAQARPTPAVIPLRDDLTGAVAGTLWMLAGAGAIVLLVASANVANLLLVRADARQLEVAVREALGASRRRVLAHYLGEAVILTTTASGLGLVAAWVAVRAVASNGSLRLPRAAELDIDGATVAFAMLIAVAGALLGSLLLATRGRTPSLFGVLRDNSPSSTGSRSRHRLRRAVAATQVALALVALNGSALLLRTVQKLHAVRPGFDATDVTTYWMQLAFARYGDSSAAAFYTSLTERVATVPGVRAVGITSRLPLAGGGTELPFYPDPATAPAAVPHAVQTASADSGYFAAMRIPLLAGRLFTALRMQPETEVVVSRAAARDFWGDASGRAALGKRFRVVAGGPMYSVIGVVDDVRDRALEQPPVPTVYFPQVAAADPELGRRPQRTMALVVRSDHRAAVTAAVRRIVREANPTLPLFDIESMDEVLRESTARLSVVLSLVGAAALVTLVLGAIGLYGVMAYAIALRSRELSLRIVLGAEPRRLVRMLSAQGVAVAALGMSGGLLLFAVLGRFLRAFLYEIGPGDPLTLASTSAALLLIALVASWLPARRAARLDPNSVLRSS